MAEAEPSKLDENPEPTRGFNPDSGNANSMDMRGGLIAIERLQQLKVKVQAVLGVTPLSISELANLEKGDVIKLDTCIGDSISILANGDEIARAEIVVTPDQPPRFGLTLTEIVETKDAPSE